MNKKIKVAIAIIPVIIINFFIAGVRDGILETIRDIKEYLKEK